MQLLTKARALLNFHAAYRLCTFDTRALHHILNTPSVYEKPALARNLLADLMGRGLITAEGMTTMIWTNATRPELYMVY